MDLFLTTREPSFSIWTNFIEAMKRMESKHENSWSGLMVGMIHVISDSIDQKNDVRFGRELLTSVPFDGWNEGL